MRSKYHAQPTVVAGRRYASKGEAERAAELRLIERAGAITALVEQPRVQLEPGIYYRADWSYTENGRLVFEDFKGVVTERFRLVCKLWRLHGPAVLRITARKGRGFAVVREILPKGEA